MLEGWWSPDGNRIGDGLLIHHLTETKGTESLLFRCLTGRWQRRVLGRSGSAACQPPDQSIVSCEASPQFSNKKVQHINKGENQIQKEQIEKKQDPAHKRSNL